MVCVHIFLPANEIQDPMWMEKKNAKFILLSINYTYRYMTEGLRTVSYSICPKFESLSLEQCIIDNDILVLKSKHII